MLVLMVFPNKYKKEFRHHIAQFVYGATDGTVTTFAIVAGAQGASLGPKTALIMGFANLFADGLKKKYRFSGVFVRSLVTFIAFVLAGAVPLTVYVYAFAASKSDGQFFIWSLILSGLCFLLIGALKGLAVRRGIVKSMIETLMLGSSAAAIAYFAGVILERMIG